MTDDTIPLLADAHDPARPSVERLAADAALGVAGVHALGAPIGRAFAGAASRVSGRDAVPGVRVVPLNGRTRVEVSIVADHPVEVRPLAAEVRSRVAAAIADRVDGPLAVDVTVSDVFGPLDRRREEAAAARAAKAEELKDRVQAAADDAKDRVQTAAGDASDAVRATASDAKDRAQDAAEDARDAARAAARDARSAAAEAKDQAQAAAADVGDRAAETAATVQVRVQEAREQAADRIEADAAGRAAARDEDEGSADVVVEVDAAGAPVAAVEGESVVVVVTEPTRPDGAAADAADQQRDATGGPDGTRS